MHIHTTQHLQWPLDLKLYLIIVRMICLQTYLVIYYFTWKRFQRPAAITNRQATTTVWAFNFYRSTIVRCHNSIRGRCKKAIMFQNVDTTMANMLIWSQRLTILLKSSRFMQFPPKYYRATADLRCGVCVIQQCLNLACRNAAFAKNAKTGRNNSTLAFMVPPGRLTLIPCCSFYPDYVLFRNCYLF